MVGCWLIASATAVRTELTDVEGTPEAASAAGSMPQRMSFALKSAGGVSAGLGAAAAAMRTVLFGSQRTYQKIGIDFQAFFSNLREVVDLGDVTHGLIKSLSFAVVIGLVSCHQGLAATMPASNEL